MHDPAFVRPRIVDSLYREALELSDEVRAGFDLSEMEAQGGKPDDPYRVTLSCEALRATTRMMHAVAWLLNHRAYLRGELSKSQLLRAGDLSRLPDRNTDRIARLPEDLRSLIEATEGFYLRLLRIEEEWRHEGEQVPPPVGAMQDRLAQVFAKAS